MGKCLTLVQGGTKKYMWGVERQLEYSWLVTHWEAREMFGITKSGRPECSCALK